MDSGFSVSDKSEYVQMLQLTCESEFSPLLTHLKNKLEDKLYMNKESQ